MTHFILNWSLNCSSCVGMFDSTTICVSIYQINFIIEILTYCSYSMPIVLGHNLIIVSNNLACMCVVRIYVCLCVLCAIIFIVAPCANVFCCIPYDVKYNVVYSILPVLHNQCMTFILTYICTFYNKPVLYLNGKWFGGWFWKTALFTDVNFACKSHMLFYIG